MLCNMQLCCYDLHKIWHGYLGDGTRNPKWHVNRFKGVTHTKGWMLMVCAFFVRSLAQLGVKPLYRFWRFISQNACFCDSCIPLGFRTRYHNFRGQSPPKPPKIGPNRHFPARMPESYNGNIQYLQNSKPNRVEIWSSTGDHNVLIQKDKIRSQGSVAWVTWPTFKF